MGKFVYIKTDNQHKKRTNLYSLINSPMGGFESEVRTSHGGDSMFYSSFTAITVHFDFNLNCLHTIQSIKGMIAHLRRGTKGHGSKYNTHTELQKKIKRAYTFLHWFAFALCAGNCAKVGQVIKRSHFASL